MFDSLIYRTLYVIAPILDPRTISESRLINVLEILNGLEVDDLVASVNVHFDFPRDVEQLCRSDHLLFAREIFHHERILTNAIYKVVALFELGI